jgi:N-acetylglucosamine kinase
MTEQPAEPKVLGVDGGGSRTVCVVADHDGREMARAFGGPSNHQSVGMDAARQAIAEAVAGARQAAGNPPLAAACFGMAGLDRAEDERVLEGLLEPLLPDTRLLLVHDAEIALVGGTGGRREGVVVIAGTGSIAVGYDGAGRKARAGGWGHVLGDEGSGHQIAQRGLNAATRARDGRGPATALLERLPPAAGAASLEELASRIYLESWSAAQIAALAPVVLGAADEGDAVARGIVASSGHELSRAAVAVIRALGIDDNRFEVVLSGGIFAGSSAIFEAVREEIRAFAPQADIHLPRHEPVVGAILLALREAQGGG